MIITSALVLFFKIRERPGPRLDNRFLTLSGPGTGNGILMGLRKTGLKGG